MWLAIGIFIAVIIILSLDDIIEIFKSKNPLYQKEKEEQLLKHENEGIEILNQLKGFINSDCQIESDEFYYMSKPSKLNAKILSVDNEWVKFITDKNKNKKSIIILKIEDVASVSKIL